MRIKIVKASGKEIELTDVMLVEIAEPYLHTMQIDPYAERDRYAGRWDSPVLRVRDTAIPDSRPPGPPMA